jgi:predicted GNAT family acetyltransferase
MGEYQDIPPYLVEVEDRGQTVLAVIRTPPDPALYSFDPDPLEEKVIQLVIDDLYDAFGNELTGIRAMKSMAAQLAVVWWRRSRKKPFLKMAMRIYKLEQVKPVSGVPGRIRPIDNGDISLILEWYGNFHREALQEESDPEFVKKQITRYFEADSAHQGLMIWEDGGKPVSVAGYAGPTTNGIWVGVVYTPPELRRKVTLLPVPLG